MHVLEHVVESFCLNSCILAQSATTQLNAESLGFTTLMRHLTAATIFSLLGILVLAICIYLFDRVVPFSFRKEILEDQNTALGIIVAAVLLGMSIIIAAAIQG